MSRTQRWTWGRGLEVHMPFLHKFHPLLPYYTILKEHMKRYAGPVFQNCLCGSFLLRFLPWKVPTNSLTYVRAVSHLLCSLTAESPPNFLTSRGLVTWSSDQEQYSPSDENATFWRTQNITKMFFGTNLFCGGISYVLNKTLIAWGAWSLLVILLHNTPKDCDFSNY